ncbi:hypothetical protein [Ezakiella peruensis]|uniref:hypothetical protein n=1 Tax=Ezakiella peruensis TaxID=1464038 RepID=UPI000C1B173E|nr:hypothetical protein [Ezakiella peruensis]
MDNKDNLIFEFLNNIADDENLINNNQFNVERLDIICNKLKDIYSDDYRHKYSSIFTFITDINNKENAERLINNLINNLNCINEYFEEKTCNLDDDTKKSFKKLLDHVNLDVSRINYLKGLLDLSKSKLEEVKKDAVENQEKLNEQTNILSNKVDRHTYDMIGVASLIFSAFSLMSINVTLFAAISSREGISILNIILLTFLFNLITVTSIFVIYKMIKGIAK